MRQTASTANTRIHGSLFTHVNSQASDIGSHERATHQRRFPDFRMCRSGGFSHSLNLDFQASWCDFHDFRPPHIAPISASISTISSLVGKAKGEGDSPFVQQNEPATRPRRSPARHAHVAWSNIKPPNWTAGNCPAQSADRSRSCHTPDRLLGQASARLAHEQIMEHLSNSLRIGT